MNISRTGLSLTTALTLTSMLTAPAWAQEGSGLRGTLSFSQSIEASDNPELLSSSDGTVLTSRTGLGFRLDSETRTEILRFSLGADLEGELGGDSSSTDGFELTNKRALIDYARLGANSRLSFGVRVREANVDDEVFGFFVDGEFDPDALIIDGGTRRTTSASATLETGIEGPLGFRIRASTSSTRYTDTLDPELEDSDTISVDTTTRFRINPALTARVIAGFSQKDEDDFFQTERDSTYVGAGLEGELGTGLTYEATVIFDKSETLNGGVVVDEENGTGFELTVVQAQPDGSLSFGASSRVDDAGRFTTAKVGRVYDLRDGGLAVSLGVLDRDNDSVRLTAGLTYSRETPRGEFVANLTQSPGTDDGDAYVNTSLSLAYQQAINATSSWDAEVRYSSANELGGNNDDSRTRASIAYRRELTRDWGMRTGFEHERVAEDGGDTRSSNTLFLSVERDITFGF